MVYSLVVVCKSPNIIRRKFICIFLPVGKPPNCYDSLFKHVSDNMKYCFSLSLECPYYWRLVFIPCSSSPKFKASLSRFSFYLFCHFLTDWNVHFICFCLAFQCANEFIH